MKRIASMAFLELIHRIFEQYKRFVSRFYTPEINQTFNSNKPLPKFPGFRDGLIILENDHKLPCCVYQLQF